MAKVDAVVSSFLQVLRRDIAMVDSRELKVKRIEINPAMLDLIRDHAHEVGRPVASLDSQHAWLMGRRLIASEECEINEYKLWHLIDS